MCALKEKQNQRRSALACGRHTKTQTYFNKCKGKEAGTKQTKQGLGAKEKGKGRVNVRGWAEGDFVFLPISLGVQQHL